VQSNAVGKVRVASGCGRLITWLPTLRAKSPERQRVVGDDAVDVGDVVGSEPEPCSRKEGRGGLALFISQRLGVGQPGDPSTIECRWT
jgi:hypothetical protein